MIKTPRSSPSGPLYATSGFRIRGNFANSSISQSFTFPSAADYELKQDPATSVAPFMRAQLSNCSLARRYRIIGEVPLRTLVGWGSTAQLETNIAVSIDGGSNWMEIGFARTASQGGPEFIQTSVKTSFLGSDITGLVEGGTILARLTQNNGGGTNSQLSVNSYGTAAQCSISLEEEVA
jgi:hypothetical protein